MKEIKMNYLQNVRQFLFLLTLLFLTAISFGQKNGTTLKGVIKDSVDKKGIGFVTVAVFPYKDTTTSSVPVQADFTTDNGSFVLREVPAGTYRMEIAMLGYRPVIKDKIRVDSLQPEIDMGEIQMTPQEETTAEVIITAQKPIMEMKDDKIIYNVENDLMAQSSVAIEVLKKVPFVTVDQEDKIRVQGQTSFKVLVNGKSTGVISRNPSEALRAFPASAIKKVEVITQPGAKYDAEGASAILNIITKKQISGYNANVYGSINTLKQGWGGGYLNLKKNKLGVSAYLGLNNWTSPLGTFSSFRQSFIPANLYTQNYTGQSQSVWTGIYGNIELAYDFDSLTSMSMYNNTSTGASNGFSENHLIQQGENNEIQKTNDFQNKNDGKDFDSEVGMDLIRKFGKSDSDHELTLSFLIGQGRNNTFADVQSLLEPGQDIFYRNDNQEKNREITGNIDYTLPFREKHSFQTGVKTIFRNMSADYEYLERDSITQQYQVQLEQSNRFDYRQDIYAGYGDYTLNLKKWTFKSGLRVEHTEIQGNFYSVDSLIRNQFTNIIPSVSVNFKPKMGQSVRLGYNKRIQRPSISELNPFVNKQNPYFWNTGNPYLKPAVTHNVSLGYNRFGGFGSINVSLSQSFVSAGIDDFTTFNPEQGVSVSNNFNIGRSAVTSLNSYYNGEFKQKLSGYLSGSVSYRILSSTQGATTYRNSGFTGNAYCSFQYKIGKNWSISTEGNFWGGNVQLQGRSNTWYGYSLGVRRTFFSQKLSFTLSAQNFLQRYIRYRNFTEDPSFYYESTSQTPNRAIRFLFSYRFGELKENVSRKKGITNDDVKSGGKGGQK